MADDDTTGAAPFLKRWSKLKQADADKDPDIDEANVIARTDEPTDESDEATQAVDPPPDLPDIATLDAESDFTGFLQDGVPEQLKRAALRKLWRFSPELAVLDGLNDYDEDFSIANAIAETVISAYKAGEGYVKAEVSAGEKDSEGESEETPQGQTEGAVDDESGDDEDDDERNQDFTEDQPRD